MSDYITERELKAHLEPIKEDVSEIKDDVKTLTRARYHDSILGGRGQMIFLYALPALLSGAIAAAVALFVN